MQEIEPIIGEKIIAEERRALLQGDIPCFHSLPFQTTLYAQSNLVAPNALRGPVLHTIIDHLKKMDNRDCQLQTTFIRQSFLAQTIKAHNVEISSYNDSVYTTEHHKKTISNTLLLHYAQKIAEEILDHAIRNKDESLNWIGFQAVPSTDQFILRPLNNALYTGNMGIALFFAALYSVTRKPQWKKEAINATQPLLNLLHNKMIRWLIPACGIGGMSGIGSILYAVQHVGRLTEESELLRESLSLFDYLEARHIHEDQQYDIISGSAGLLLALLSIYSQTCNEKALSCAKLCGEHLCRSALDRGNGAVAWRKKNDPQPLLGFSHGNAGIAYALIKLSEHIKDAHLLDFAKRALAYERSFFSLEKGNWPDLRVDHQPPSYPVQWCHGAAGGGLSRLASLSLYQDQETMQEVEVALQTTQAFPFSTVAHLCCGTFGRLEFILEAARTLERRVLEEQIRESVGDFFAKIGNGKPSAACSNCFNDYYNPTFMQGMAGIGYTLLRLQDQKRELPQILLLQ